MYKSTLSQVVVISSLLIITTLFCQQSMAKSWLVDTQQAYKTALDKVVPGDEIVLANGNWENFEVLFSAKGTKDKLITLRGETKGKVFLTGQSNLRIAGEYLVVTGLVFTQGYTPTSEVISFRQNKKNLANNVRVTEVVIDEFSNPDRFESDYWVGLYGKNNRFDHSYLAGKRNKGVTMAVRLTDEASRENHHRIDNNYFGPRPVFGSNGGETLRIGTSHFSLTDSLTVVENNYFDRCNGEVEIISVKSGKNQIRNNVFFESRGTLTLRHGNGNVVENNVFIGNGVDHTGGIRVINRDQVVRNNYLEGLTGYRFGSGFTVMDGVPNSKINRYHQVVNANIYNNTFVNVENIHLAAGSDAERSAVPQETRIKNNLIYNENHADAFSVFDDISGISFDNNYINKVSFPKISQGFVNKPITLKRAENGLLYPTNIKGVGISDSLKPVKKSATGPSWYKKLEPVVEFSSGKTIAVSPGENTIFDAIKAANSGDKLLLAVGQYQEGKIVKLTKTITIESEEKGAAIIHFERATFIEIANGGSLKLSGITINGSEAPDSSGNVLFRTAKWGMYKNYRFVVEDSTFADLDVNHSFHFFDAGSRSLATDITVTNSTFNNITGDLFRLNKETDDLGIYNASYLTITGNVINKVGGALVKLYRGGRDESTFGPHLLFSKNTVTDSGKEKRNKSKALIALHGVQVTNIADNTITNSAGISVEHTNGEPRTDISNNTFNQTPAPTVIELHAKGPHTATLNNNKVN